MPAGGSLEPARKLRNEAKGLFRRGVDPSAHKRQFEAEQAIAHANTFGVVADGYLAKLEREGRADATMEKVRWLLDLARPAPGNRRISDITAQKLCLCCVSLRSGAGWKAPVVCGAPLAACFAMPLPRQGRKTIRPLRFVGRWLHPGRSIVPQSPIRSSSVVCCGR